MPQIIEVPGHGQVEFPDGMSDEQIVAAIRANQPRQPNEAAMVPEANTPLGTIKGESSTGFNPAAMLIKAGGALTSLARGGLQAQVAPGEWLKEKLGLQEPGGGLTGMLKQQADSEKPYVQDLQAVHPGSTLIGDMLPAIGVPWRALPAVAASDYGSLPDRLEKGAAALVGGKIAEKGGQIASRAFAKSEEQATTKAAQNAVMDQAIADAKDAGYVTVPSLSNGSLPGRLIEGATGKAKAAQLASVRNQSLTDNLVRQAFDLPETAPIARETMRAVRQDAAAAGYDPVRQLPRMDTDATYLAQVKALTSRADNAATDFGGVVQSDVKPLADDLAKVKSFTGSSAVDAASVLREKSSDLYAQGNKTLGKAYREAADAIEGQIERALTAQGKDGAATLQAFRQARARMAQTFDVEKALREGQGHVDANALGKLYAKAPSRMTGNLATIGRTAAAMPEVMRVPKDGWSNPITAVDSITSGLGSAIAGNPLPLLLPAGRVAGRYGLLGKAGQNLFTVPSYRPNQLLGATAGLLDNPVAPYAAGLLAYEGMR